MIILKVKPIPSDVEKEFIRQLIGYYRGISSFSIPGIISINPKEDFNLEGLLLTLRTTGYNVEVGKE